MKLLFGMFLEHGQCHSRVWEHSLHTFLVATFHFYYYMAHVKGEQVGEVCSQGQSPVQFEGVQTCHQA